MMKHYNWEKAKLVVEPNAHPAVGSKFCYLAMSTIRSEVGSSEQYPDWNFGPDAKTTKDALKNGIVYVIFSLMLTLSFLVFIPVCLSLSQSLCLPLNPLSLSLNPLCLSFSLSLSVSLSFSLSL